ncbi:epidermal growth factor receptor substrate 15-like 1 isoform X4 [Hydra vulgaris]|uniref:epidermal growth factor receptor substrate 15-like 1 isoform X4 n=1 Tax=Hydra vulgaris TaxID=6087 RepID=UPI001F5FC993|nr:epidermal growth factor receptor substrate 15-like 1 isoform X4 [Hydra vulgaris]
MSQNTSVYETYFRQANPSGSGIISAIDAAAFLKKSGLPEVVLHKIWEISDSDNKGCLDKQKFNVALKLVALAQNGKEVSLKLINTPTPPPNMALQMSVDVGIESHESKNLGMLPSVGNVQTSDFASWSIKPKEKAKYDALFESLKPVNGFLTGEVVKPVLMNSKLPFDTLGKIWDLSDIDHDGSLDQDEFSLAMYLIYRAIEGGDIPLVLPLSIIPASKRASTTQLSSGVSANKTLSQTSSDWVVSAPMKTAYDQKFILLDTNKDGLVSGAEIKDILIASGLPQPVLAHIWNLCDTNNSGLLNSEQFALAMHLIAQKRSGKELPQTLSSNMIPPSMKISTGNDLTTISMESTFNDFSAIKELDKVSTEIENLGKEKANLQKEISQTENAIKARRSEMEDLQVNLEKANKGLEILTQKKSELQKQLDSLDSEQSKLSTSIEEVLEQCEQEKITLKQLKSKLASQKSDVKEQEQELHKGRKELEELKKEESLLEQQVAESMKKLEKIKSKVAASKNEALQDLFQIKHDPFAMSISDSDPFSSEDPFKSESFKAFSNDPFSSDPFQNDDPFKSDPFVTSQGSLKGDPFLSIDPFESGGFSSNSKSKTKVDSDFSSKGSNFASFGDDSDVHVSNKFSESSNNALISNDPFSNSASTPSFTSTETSKIKFSSDSFSTDPFGSGGPFANSEDPFANSEDPFSSTATAKSVETTTTDPFSSNKNDPFSIFSSSDPFSSTSKKTDPFFDSKDPFGAFTTTKQLKDDDDWFAFGKNEGS